MFLSLYFLWLLPPAQCGIYGVLHLPQPYDFLPEWLVLRRQFGLSLIHIYTTLPPPAAKCSAQNWGTWATASS